MSIILFAFGTSRLMSGRTSNILVKPLGEKKACRIRNIGFVLIKILTHNFKLIISDNHCLTKSTQQSDYQVDCVTVTFLKQEI